MGLVESFSASAFLIRSTLISGSLGLLLSASTGSTTSDFLNGSAFDEAVKLINSVGQRFIVVVQLLIDVKAEVLTIVG